MAFKENYAMVCERCGSAFVAGSASAKYCAGCRELVRREKKALRRKDRDQRYKPEPPENIRKCLSCKRKSCPGICVDMQGGAAG